MFQGNYQDSLDHVNRSHAATLKSNDHVLINALLNHFETLSNTVFCDKCSTFLEGSFQGRATHNRLCSGFTDLVQIAEDNQCLSRANMIRIAENNQT